MAKISHLGQILDFYPNAFCPLDTPHKKKIAATAHQHTNFEQKTPNIAKIECFLPSVAFLSVKKTPDSYFKICEKASQKAGTQMYTMSMLISHPHPPA